MKKRTPKKILVILPPDDVKRIEDQVLDGKYVTKSDFFRIAVKQLLYGKQMSDAEEIKIIQPQENQNALTPQQILTVLKENRTKISSFGVKQVGLFGSYIRNEQNAESDIDILVVFSKDKKSFHSYMQLKLFLERIFKKKVDLVVKSAVRPELRQRILKSVVYA